MTLSFGFYNSQDDDRVYTAQDFSTFVDGIISDGVFPNVGLRFLVLPSNNGSQIQIQTGKAWFNGIWVYNDGVITLDLEPAEDLPRIDRLIIEVLKEDGAVQIRWLRGLPATNPVAPTLLRSDRVNQYSIGTVTRPKNYNMVKIQDIIIDVGTNSLCPIAKSTVDSIPPTKTLHTKRSMSRGRNLGSVFTSQQRKSIRDGSFEDLYLGDYWVFNGVKWRIVDFNYWMGQKGTASLTNLTTNARIVDNHIVIVPDDVRGLVNPNLRMNYSVQEVNCGVGATGDPNASGLPNFGYYTPQAPQTYIAYIYKKALPLFGESRIVRRRPYLPKGISGTGYRRYMTNMIPVTKWFATPMNESQITGVRSTTTLSFLGSEDRQFAYYELDQRNIWPEGVVYPFWLMTNWSLNRPNCFHDWDLCSTDYGKVDWTYNPQPIFLSDGSVIYNETKPPNNIAGGSHYERPVFGVTGV